MESFIDINISRLPSGLYLATTTLFSEVKEEGKTILEALDRAKAHIENLKLLKA